MRRPPKMKASTGTPSGFSHSGSMHGQFAAGAVKRAFGWDEGLPQAGVQSSPSQLIKCAGGSSVMPSHQTSPSSVSAQLVKMLSRRHESIALGLVEYEVPGATPNHPASGLIARGLPSGPGWIHAMSSPTVVTL